MSPITAWQPQPGSQQFFLTTQVTEALNEGTRGRGGTDALLMDFAQHVGQGFGVQWRGVLFRRTYPELDDIVTRSKRWFHQIFPAAQFKASKGEYAWIWPSGEELLLRRFHQPDDYWSYHGHEYPWQGWDDLTIWPTLEGYHRMKSCCRSTLRGVPLKIRATANPWGVGHNAVKAYFIDPAPAGVPVQGDKEHGGLWRVRIRGHWSENRALLTAQPNYPDFVAAAATNPEQRKAWLAGDWDIVAGGMFDDVWDRHRHLLKPWPAIPRAWRVDRSYDWGSARPFSVGWWVESDGTEAPDGRFYPRGSLIRIAEWYGWNGQPNEGCRMLADAIARGILEREKAWRDRGWVGAVTPGPADASIFVAEDGVSIADTMRQLGVTWHPADKRPGSRKSGWERMRKMLAAARAPKLEDPGLWVFETCTHFVRTVPVLPRSDRDPDDVDTEAEDHTADETRYRVMDPRREARVRTYRV